MIMEPNPEAKAMSDLPLDITINIFSRLPVKSLGQLKCACKSWNSLISSPQFVKLHHDRVILDAENDLNSHFRLYMSMIPCHSLDYESPSSLTDLSRSLEVDTDYILGENVNYLVGSCYGFIYFVCYQDCIIVWNPCTKQARNLPNPPIPSSDVKYFYGLGYENGNSTCEYKLVRIIHLGVSKSTKVEVFNLQTSSSWKSIEAFDSNITILDEKGTFANGALHWKATRVVGSDTHEMILSLDIRNETFREISMPKLGDRSGSFWCLGDSKGRLFMQVGGDCNDVDIWVMKEYGAPESWTRLVTYKWQDFDCDNGLSFICFAKNGDGILNADGWFLVRFDTRERRSRYYKKLNEDWFNCFMYVESLVSPQDTVGCLGNVHVTLLRRFQNKGFKLLRRFQNKSFNIS